MTRIAALRARLFRSMTPNITIALGWKPTIGGQNDESILYFPPRWWCGVSVLTQH